MTPEQTEALHAETRRYLIAYAKTRDKSYERLEADADHKERVAKIIAGEARKRPSGRRLNRGIRVSARGLLAPDTAKSLAALGHISCDPFCDPLVAKTGFR